LPDSYPHTQICGLQLDLTLRLAQDRIQPRSLHNITPDLEFALHEQILRLLLALNQLPEIRIAENDGDYNTALAFHLNH
jgi:hypothetical protein